MPPDANLDEWLGYGKADGIDAVRIETLLAERQQARMARDFARADAIRTELDGLGIVIEDTPDGPKWRRASC